MRAVSMAALAGAGLLLGACGPSDASTPVLRQMSLSYSYTVTADDLPPHAREAVHYTITVFDRKTRQPIENGEGQIFANGEQGGRTWDGFVYGPEIGTYHAKLNFVLPGLWAMAIRFRQDSLHPLERIDWMQDVINERAPVTP